MTNFLIKKIEKSALAKKDLRSGFGISAGVFGLFSNLLLFVLKIFIGLISGSVSIMADAVNNLSDTASSVITLVGFQIAGKPADKEHPYGHERFEYISGLMVSLLIIFVGFQFFSTSFNRILNPQSVKVSLLTFVILVLSIFIKIWQSYFYRQVAKKIDSNTLITLANDSRNDVFTTITVLISAGAELLTGLRIDGIVGLLIAIYIVLNGMAMIKGFIDSLLGMGPNEKEIEQMKERLSSHPSILGYHDLLTHTYGPNKKYASVHIEVDDQWDLNRAHAIIDQIEQDFLKNLDVHLVCHIDPIAIHDPTQNKIYNEMKQLIYSYHLDLRFHDYRMEKKGNNTIIRFDVVVPQTVKLSDQELLTRIQEDVKNQIGSYELDIVFDHNYLLSR